MPIKNPVLEKIRNIVKNLSFILGIRKSYYPELLLTLLGLISFATFYILLGQNIPSYISLTVTGIFLSSPVVLQYYNYRRKLKIYGEAAKEHVPPPAVPLITIILSLITSIFAPILGFIAILNAFFVEDFTPYFLSVDIVKIKKGLSILLAPFSRFEFVIIFIGVLIPSLAAYSVTQNLLVFVYPVIAYIMVIYSIILVPPEYRTEAKTGGILEEFSRRIPYLYQLFMVTYTKPNSVRKGKEAGYIGNSYFELIHKMSGAFTIATYASLAVSPVLFIFIGTVSLLTPLIVSAVMFFIPNIVLSMKRSSRAGKISRNLMLIISYLASIASVAEDFTSAMMFLKQNKELAKLFGLEREVEIYLNIWASKGSTEEALKEYASTVPNELYKDTLRTIGDLLEHEGYGAVFRSLVSRLKDFTLRYIDSIRASFESIGSNIISVTMLLQTVVPIISFLSDPSIVPWFILMGSAMSSILIMIIGITTLPDLPSEFINTKPRYRRAGLVFVVIASGLTLLERYILPDLLSILIPLNIIPAFFYALYYASSYDIKLNNDFLNKFPDLLILFSSAMTISNSASRALLELSTQETFTERMRHTFRKLANIFEYFNIEKLTYKGMYWYKYFVFLASIGSRYGTTPRELYKSISEFMLEYKKFFASVRNFAKTLLFLGLLSVVVLNLEVTIIFGFIDIMNSSGLQQSASQLGVSLPVPTVEPSKLEQLKTTTYISLLVNAIATGIAIGKINTGTIRDGRWVLFTFVLQVLLIYIGETTSFGIHLAPTTNP